ncbi:MAG: hypothetical protein ACI4VF_10385 [Lachnospirales bacterium]
MKKTVGVIEIVSNSLRLKIGEKSPKGVKIVESVTYPLALGRDTFHNGRISFESLDKAADIIKGYLNICRDYGVSDIRAIATTAIREAQNKDYILDQLKLKTGIRLNVIDESQEKIYISKIVFGKLDDDKKDSSLIIHLGSGNISIFVVHEGAITGTLNIKLGALRLSELFDETIEHSAEYVQIIKEYIHPFYEAVQAFIKDKTANFIISGNDTDAIAEMCNAKVKGNSRIISRDSFSDLYSLIKNKTPDNFASEYNIADENKETLIATIVIISRLLKFTTAKNIVSPIVSIGDAMLFQSLYPSEEKKFSKIFSQFAISSSFDIALKFGCDRGHIERVSNTALKIFDRMKKIHGMGEKERLMLNIAAILQDIGKSVNVKNHNELSYHMINGVDIVGINEDERNIVAASVYYHGSVTPSYLQDVYSKLDTQSKVTVSKLSAILKLANAIHSSHNLKFEDINVRLSGKELIITVSTFKNINLEKWSFKSKSKLFADVYGIKAQLRKRSVM